MGSLEFHFVKVEYCFVTQHYPDNKKTFTIMYLSKIVSEPELDFQNICINFLNSRNLSAI